MNSQSCPESLGSARSYHWEWCTINNELRTTSGRRVLGGHPRHRCGAPTGHLTRICRRTCQPREVVASRAPREAGLATAPAFLPPPGQAGGARPRRQVDQAPDCSSWLWQKYRAGLEAPFWWRRNWSVELELLRVDAQRVRRGAGPALPATQALTTQRAPWWRSRRGVLKRVVPRVVCTKRRQSAHFSLTRAEGPRRRRQLAVHRRDSAQKHGHHQWPCYWPVSELGRPSSQTGEQAQAPTQ